MRLILSCLILIAASCSSTTDLSSNAPRNSASETSVPKDPPLVTTKVILTSPDGVRIAGSLYETFYPKSPGVLLLHQWQSDRHSFDELARQLQKRKINVLSIDGRGFGESTETIDGKKVTVGRSSTDVNAMLSDVATALDVFANQKNVDPNRIGIVGASYGSSLAIIYAADHPEVKTVVLLSPGLNYFGNMPTESAVRKFRARSDHNLLFIAAEDDKEAVDAVNKLNPIEVDSRRYPQQILKSGGHGTALLKVETTETISDFFADRFGLANLNIRP